MELDLNNVLLLGIAAATAISSFWNWKAKQISEKTAITIQLLEKNTNSIKDALVASVGTERFAAGQKEARVEGELKAAALLEGKIQGIKETVAAGPQPVEVVNPTLTVEVVNSVTEKSK